MNNWSIAEYTDGYLTWKHSNIAYISNHVKIYTDCKQCAGINDKKWMFCRNIEPCTDDDCYYCAFKDKCPNDTYFIFLRSIQQAANTRYYTPEQQEIISYIENGINAYDYAYSLYKDEIDYLLKDTYSTIKARVIEIINKYKRLNYI